MLQITNWWHSFLPHWIQDFQHKWMTFQPQNEQPKDADNPRHEDVKV